MEFFAEKSAILKKEFKAKRLGCRDLLAEGSDKKQYRYPIRA